MSELSRPKKEAPKVSIIITNFRETDYLMQCLSAVSKTDYPNFEIIVVDYGTDGLERCLQSEIAQIKLIRLDHDPGVAAARNFGLRNSDGELLAFLDNDTIPDPDWLKNSIPLLLADSRIGAVQPLLLDFSNPQYVDGAGSFVDISGYPMERGRLFNRDRKHPESFSKVEPIFGASGASFIVKREAIRKVGAFDEAFIIDLEDLDLSWRIRLAGYEILLAPDSKVFHRRRSKQMKDSGYRSMREFCLLKNQLLCLIKNAESRSLLKYLPLIIASYSVRFFMPRKIICVLALRAFVWNMSVLPVSVKKRQMIQRIVRKVPDSELKAFIVPFPVILFSIFFGTETLTRLVEAVQQQQKWNSPI